MSKETGIKGVRVFDKPLYPDRPFVYIVRRECIMIIIGRVVFTEPSRYANDISDKAKREALEDALSDANWILNASKRKWMDARKKRADYAKRTGSDFDVEEFHRLFTEESDALAWASFWNFRRTEIEMIIFRLPQVA